MKRLLLALILSLCWGQVSAQSDRYPFRIPDWLWLDELHAPLIDEAERRRLLAELKQVEALEILGKIAEADKKNEEITKSLSAAFSLRQLSLGATVIVEPTSGLSLAVHIDPAFTPEMTDVLRRAIPIYLKYALDDEVISKAFNRSVERPNPMPEQFVMKDGKPEEDGLGQKMLSDQYRLFLRSISKPPDVASFKRHLRSVLTSDDADPPLLVISRYGGGPWWGAGYYHFYNDPLQRLARLQPSRGYLYIRLHADKMQPGQPRYNDPVFWASKIAHETGHNFGYWHPPYKDPAERDQHNVGMAWAFLVSYEIALLEKADREAARKP